MGQVVGQDTTYMGNPATFTGIADSVITELNTDIDPAQDLHGYSKPWAAGAGKNKLYVPAGSSTVNGTTFAVASDGSVTLTNAPTSNATKLVCTFTLPAGSYIYTSGITEQRDVTVDTFIQKSGTTIARGNNSDSPGNSFTLTEESTLNFDIRVHSGYNPNNLVVKPMIRLSSVSDATWEPYENICPITGWTGANVYRTGKNLCRVACGWSSNQGITYTENADGTVHCKGTATAESFSASNVTTAGNRDSRCMYTVPAGTYTISNIAGVRLWVQFRNADNTAQTGTNVNIAVGSSKTVTFTEPAIIYIRSDIATGTAVDADMQVMVTAGSTAATVYEPWQKQTVTVDWTSVAGTVYEGSFDPVTGALLSTMANIASYNGETIGEPWLSSLDEYSPGATPTTGAQVVYTLATPVEYQLTPQVITALIGPNYIWTDLNNTVTLTVRAPMNGFAGWLIKAVTNGTPIEIPLKYIRAETYTVTPDQRMEWSAERDVTGVLHRETVQNLPPKIEFNTPLMTNADINTLNGIIRAAFTNYLQRNITIQFYDPERDQYWEWDCYMPDVHYSIRNADTVNHIINYEELRYAFIGY